VIYQYQCERGHTVESIRKIAQRHDPVTCDICREPMHLIISRPAGSPDGVYSYAPNLGNANAFELRQMNIRVNRERAKDGLRPQVFEKYEGD